MKKIILIYLIITLVFSHLNLVLAQEEVNQADDELINKNIKERIEKVTKSEEKIALKKSKAVTGTVSSVTNNTITIKHDSETILISFTQDTEFVRNPGSKSVDKSDIAIGDFIIAMGTINTSEVLDSKRIVLSEETPLKNNKMSAIGNIQDIDLKTKEITLTKPNGEEIILKQTKSSQMLQKSEREKETIKLNDLETANKVVVVYSPQENEKDSNDILSLLAIPNTNSSDLTDDSDSKAQSSPTSSAKVKATSRPAPKASSSPSQE